MTEEEIKQKAHEYAEKQIKHKMAVHDIFNKEQATEEIEQAFIEGTDFMYYSNNEELKKELTEKDKRIEELKGLKDVATLIKANGSTTVTLMELNNHLVSANQKIKDLEAQIEKMRNCENCIKGYSDYGKVCKDCKDFSNWKLKE